MEAKFDGGRFDARRWYVDGYAMHWFSTKEDAEAAIGLAGQVAVNECREMHAKVQRVLDSVEP